MAIPTKSAWAFVGLDFASCSSAEVAPKTVVISVPVFSRAVLPESTEPKLQPARVNGTQGAGAFWPLAVSMLYVVSSGEAFFVSFNGSVQYVNELAILLVPSV